MAGKDRWWSLLCNCRVWCTFPGAERAVFRDTSHKCSNISNIQLAEGLEKYFFRFLKFGALVLNEVLSSEPIYFIFQETNL